MANRLKSPKSTLSPILNAPFSSKSQNRTQPKSSTPIAKSSRLTAKPKVKSSTVNAKLNQDKINVSEQSTPAASLKRCQALNLKTQHVYAMASPIATPGSEYLSDMSSCCSVDGDLSTDSNRSSPTGSPGSLSIRTPIGEMKTKYRNELWSAIRSDYRYLMDDEIIETCKSTESDLSLESDDQGTSVAVSYNDYIQKYNELNDWLGQVQQMTQRQSTSLSEKYLNQTFHKEMLHRLTRLKHFKDYAKQLMRRFPMTKDAIEENLNEVNSRWEALEKLIQPHNGKHSDIRNILLDIERDLKGVRQWIVNTDVRLKMLKLQPHWTAEDIMQELINHEVMQHEIQSPNKILFAALSLCERLEERTTSLSEEEADDGMKNLLEEKRKSLQLEAKDIQKQYHSIWLRSLEWQMTLEDARDNGIHLPPGSERSDDQWDRQTFTNRDRQLGLLPVLLEELSHDSEDGESFGRRGLMMNDGDGRRGKKDVTRSGIEDLSAKEEEREDEDEEEESFNESICISDSELEENSIPIEPRRRLLPDSFARSQSDPTLYSDINSLRLGEGSPNRSPEVSNRMDGRSVSRENSENREVPVICGDLNPGPRRLDAELDDHNVQGPASGQLRRSCAIDLMAAFDHGDVFLRREPVDVGYSSGSHSTEETDNSGRLDFQRPTILVSSESPDSENVVTNSFPSDHSDGNQQIFGKHFDVELSHDKIGYAVVPNDLDDGGVGLRVKVSVDDIMTASSSEQLHRMDGDCGASIPETEDEMSMELPLDDVPVVLSSNLVQEDEIDQIRRQEDLPSRRPFKRCLAFVDDDTTSISDNDKVNNNRRQGLAKGIFEGQGRGVASFEDEGFFRKFGHGFIDDVSTSDTDDVRCDLANLRSPGREKNLKPPLKKKHGTCLSKVSTKGRGQGSLNGNGSDDLISRVSSCCASSEATSSEYDLISEGDKVGDRSNRMKKNRILTGVSRSLRSSPVKEFVRSPLKRRLCESMDDVYKGANEAQKGVRCSSDSAIYQHSNQDVVGGKIRRISVDLPLLRQQGLNVTNGKVEGRGVAGSFDKPSKKRTAQQKSPRRLTAKKGENLLSGKIGLQIVPDLFEAVSSLESNNEDRLVPSCGSVNSSFVDESHDNIQMFSDGEELEMNWQEEEYEQDQWDDDDEFEHQLPYTVTFPILAHNNSMNRSRQWEDSDSDVEDFQHVLQESRIGLKFIETTILQYGNLCENGFYNQDPTEFMEPLATCQTNIVCLQQLIEALKSKNKMDNEIQQVNEIVTRWQQLEAEVLLIQEECRLVFGFRSDVASTEKELEDMTREIKFENFDSIEQLEEKIKTITEVQNELACKMSPKLENLERIWKKFEFDRGSHFGLESNLNFGKIDHLKLLCINLIQRCKTDGSRLKSALLSWYKFQETQSELGSLLAQFEVSHLQENSGDLKMLQTDRRKLEEKLRNLGSLCLDFHDLCSNSMKKSLKDATLQSYDGLNFMRQKNDELVVKLVKAGNQEKISRSPVIFPVCERQEFSTQDLHLPEETSYVSISSVKQYMIPIALAFVLFGTLYYIWGDEWFNQLSGLIIDPSLRHVKGPPPV